MYGLESAAPRDRAEVHRASVPSSLPREAGIIDGSSIEVITFPSVLMIARLMRFSISRMFPFHASFIIA